MDYIGEDDFPKPDKSESHKTIAHINKDVLAVPDAPADANDA